MDTQLYYNICSYLQQLIQGTKWEGHLFAVGGCCRDEVLGHEIKDLDLAVDLPLGGVGFANWLNKRRLTVERPLVFAKYSTAMFRLRKFRDEQIEIVQTRSGKYLRNRDASPADAFGSIEEDAVRRDLTINSLYRNISTGELIDFTGKALYDIAHKKLRTPVDPNLTFEDDPIRILRCIRFSCTLGWNLDRATIEAMKLHAAGLEEASRERIRGEILRIISCDDPIKALKMLRSIGVMQYAMSEVTSLYNARVGGSTLWTHSLNVAQALPCDPVLRLAALLHDIGKPESRAKSADGKLIFPEYSAHSVKIVGKILRTRKYDAKMASEVKFFCLNHSVFYLNGQVATVIKDKRLRRLLIDCQNRERFDNLIAFIRADAADLGFSDDVEPLIQRTEQIAATEGLLSNGTVKEPPAVKKKDKPRRRHRGGQRRRGKRRAPKKD